ncbi:hypothetical protein LWC35_21070 [Pseudonocardia kujensis]|uniref:hypothetical protein n=1 Tax=Pseudonocardia kujensis TaxID=1128675 RepID=UPI001E4AFDB1|nr:hypothetical protein [Pseudonocardia kujensis]MCE0765374.1 hypothetical protein [Pseudonocardia kujensis]
MTSWVPEACTLPTAERPLRVAEFDELLSTGVTEAVRVAAGHLRLTLRPERDADAADLVARESACCSFFDFALDGTALDVRVPAAHVGVLDGLVARVA